MLLPLLRGFFAQEQERPEMCARERGDADDRGNDDQPGDPSATMVACSSLAICRPHMLSTRGATSVGRA
jgi:hypothetical protein